MPSFDGGHALIVGVAGYDDPGLRIASKITVKEAESIAGVLQDPHVGAYDPSRVKLLTDPTRQKLLDALQALVQATATSRAHMVFLDFAGHGVMGDDGLYYFTTKDTVLKGSVVLAGTGVSAPDLLDKLRMIQSDKVLFIINACFSGNIQPSLSPDAKALGAPPTTTLSVEILATGEGRAVISACRDTQRSYFNSAKPLTYFGEYLAKGLKGEGVPSADGYVGLFELYQYVHMNVHDVVNGLGGTQDPVITLIRGVGPFPVALHPEAKSSTLGPFDTNKLQQTLTTGAVEELPRTVVDRIRAGRDVVQVHAGENIYTGDVTKVIDFGRSKIGSLKIGNVAGRDNIEFHNYAAAATRASDKQEFKKVVDDLLAGVENLKGLAEDTLADVRYALNEAKKAGEKGKKERLLEKMGEAEKKLLNDPGSSAESLRLAEAIGRAKQLAAGLDFAAP